MKDQKKKINVTEENSSIKESEKNVGSNPEFDGETGSNREFKGTPGSNPEHPKK